MDNEQDETDVDDEFEDEEDGEGEDEEDGEGEDEEDGEGEDEEDGEDEDGEGEDEEDGEDEDGEDEDEDEDDSEEDEDDDEPLFGRIEAAALLAVDSANGGELASLDQVVFAYYRLFDRWPEAEDFAIACQLLCEAGLTNYIGRRLELDPKGRKLLRRSGMPGHPSRPMKVMHLLQEIDEGTLADEGSIPEPAEDEIAKALGSARSQPTLASALQTAPEPQFQLLSPFGPSSQFSFPAGWRGPESAVGVAHAALEGVEVDGVALEDDFDPDEFDSDDSMPMVTPDDDDDDEGDDEDDEGDENEDDDEGDDA